MTIWFSASFVKTRMYVIILSVPEKSATISRTYQQPRLTYTYANFQSMRMQIFANTVGAGKTRWVTAVVYSFETPCDRIRQTPALSSIRLK